MTFSVFRRACDRSARVFAMDATLARAFEQLAADAQVERTRGTRWVMWHAWAALLRTSCLGVPVALLARIGGLTPGERSVVLGVFARQVSWVTAPLALAWFLGARAGFDVLVPWVYLVSNAAGAQLAVRVAAPRRAGALTALIVLTTVFWAVALLTEVTAATDVAPGPPTLLMRGLVLPLVAAQVIWLSALAAVAGRRTTLSVSQAIPLAAAYWLLTSRVVPAIPPSLTTAAVVAVIPLSLIFTWVASAWVVDGRASARRGLPE